MDDLTICKRIADIEKLNKVEIRGEVFVSHGFSCDRRYNPLTDDALCFQLSKKYNVCVMHGDECSTARIWDDPEDNPIADFSDINNDTSLNKAICLAIIEANKPS